MHVAYVFSIKAPPPPPSPPLPLLNHMDPVSVAAKICARKIVIAIMHTINV